MAIKLYLQEETIDKLHKACEDQGFDRPDIEDLVEFLLELATDRILHGPLDEELFDFLLKKERRRENESRNR